MPNVMERGEKAHQLDATDKAQSVWLKMSSLMQGAGPQEKTEPGVPGALWAPLAPVAPSMPCLFRPWQVHKNYEPEKKKENLSLSESFVLWLFSLWAEQIPEGSSCVWPLLRCEFPKAFSLMKMQSAHQGRKWPWINPCFGCFIYCTSFHCFVYVVNTSPLSTKNLGELAKMCP